MIIGVVANLRRGEYTALIPAAAVLAIVTVMILWSRRREQLFFKDPTPDRVIAFYHASIKNIPNARALAAYMSAFAAILYGEFDRAREELASVNWTTLPPMYQGLEIYIHSLFAIFEANDYSRALDLAKKARDLCDISDKFPGSRNSRVSHDANIAICEMLTGKNGTEILGRIERASKQLSGVAATIPTWALAVHHAKSGQAAVAQRYIAIVDRILPHQTPLKTVATGKWT